MDPSKSIDSSYRDQHDESLFVKHRGTRSKRNVNLVRVPAHTHARTDGRTNDDVRDDDERAHGGRCRGQGTRGYVEHIDAMRRDATNRTRRNFRGFQLRLTVN